MDVAGMQVVLSGDYTGLEKTFDAATQRMDQFKRDTLALAKVRIAPTVSIKDLNKITQLDLALKSLAQTASGGIALDVKTTDLSQLLATLKQVQSLSSGKSSLQISTSGKGLDGLNDSLKAAATYASAAESALKSLQATASTTMQFLAAQNASLATYLSTVAGISAQATQNTAQLTQAIQNTTNAAGSATSATAGMAGAAQQASQAADNVGQAFTAASARVNTFVNENADLNNSITQNVQILNQYRARMTEVSKEISNLAKMEGLSDAEAAANTQTIAQLGAEYARLKQQVSQATSTINAQAKATIAAEGSYNDLQQQLTLANQAFRRLNEADRNGVVGTASLKNIGQLNEKLKEIDATMGIYVRNVGNYSSATNYLNQTMAQLTGELPNFFQSMKMGFMSISNNIQPILFALQSLRVENERLAASGEPTVSAFSAITKSIFSWQTLLFAGIGILSRYGGDLVELAGDAIQGKTAIDKLADAQKEYAKSTADSKTIIKEFTDSLKSAHEAMISNVESAGKTVGQIKLLTATLTDTNQSMYDRKRAYDQLVAIAPEIAGSINKELTLTTQLADAINTKLIPALIQRAKAEGFSEQYKKLASEQSAAIIKQTELTESYNKALANAKGFASLESNLRNSKDLSTGFLTTLGEAIAVVKSMGANRDFEKQKKALELVNAEVDEYGKHMNTALKLFLDANQYASTLYKSLNAGEGNQKKAIQDHIKALQAQMGLVKKGTTRYAELEAELHKAQTELKAYNVTTKQTKQHVDAITKSQNNLQGALKQVNNQLQQGQVTALEAAKQKLSAYQKDLETLFRNKGSKVKIDADLSAISDLQKQIKDLTASDTLKKLNDALNVNAQLNTAGITTTLEKAKADLVDVKAAYEKLVTGKNALPLDDAQVLKVKNEAADLEKQIQALTKQHKIDLVIKSSTEGMASIAEDLKNGWVTPLEAAKERVKNLETELRALQKAGADASVIIPVKVQWAGAKQDSAVAEVQEIIKNAENAFNQGSQAVDISVKLGLVAPLDGLKDQISLKKKEINQMLKALSKVDTSTLEGNAVGQLLQDSLAHIISDVNASELAAQLQAKIQDIAVEGLAGIGEIIGGVFSGGDVGDLFGSMMQNVGDQLENLGKWMITTAAKFAILKKTFEAALKANPLLGVAAGIATVALGAAIKAAFQNKQSQMEFADGGIVYGRTSAIVGEYQGARNNPEVIAPLNKLKNILKLDRGTSAVNVNVEGVIDNDVIRLALLRADKSNNQ